MSLTVIAKMKAKAGSEKQLEQAFQAMFPGVRNEEGTLTYILHRSSKDPTVFVFYEIYANQAAFDAHVKTPHFAELSGKIGPLLDGRPVIDILEEVGRK